MLQTVLPMRVRTRPMAVLGLILAAGAMAYAALVLYSRVDEHIFPADELDGGVALTVPGNADIGIEVSLPGVAEGVTSRPWTPESRLNILVMGLDRRPWEPKDGAYRSDTLFVASIDKKHGRLQLLSIPRDTWTEVPYSDEPELWIEEKINAAYSHGQSQDLAGGGAAAAVKAVERNFSIEIDHYLVIDWVGFEALVDAIGGIDIDVAETISDFTTNTLDSFPNGTVTAGQHHMNGREALAYSRVRTDGDLKRIERQQAVIQAAAQRAVSFGHINRLPQLWEAYRDAIQTDVGSGLIPGYALLIRGLDLENIDTFSLGPAMYGGVSEAGALILLPRWDEVYAIIDDFLADPLLRDEHPSIVVEYPAGLEADAGQTRDHLAAYGISPAYVALVEGGAGEPGVYQFTDDEYTAQKLAELTDLRLLDPESAAPEGVDVLVRIGPDTVLRSP